MKELIKPQRLQPGDRVAAVSLSWGGAGDEEYLWRYSQGKACLRSEFGLETIEMPNTLKGDEYLYNHPEKRAEDLMEAFSDKSVKAIFSCTGGDESVRLLPYIDYSVIHDNPKVFMGFSDSTVTHMICLKAGVSSFYGPHLLGEIAENGGMYGYTKKWFKKALFANEPIGAVEPPDEWTSEYLPWFESNKDKKRALLKHKGYELLQGSGRVQGRLIGGCMDVLEMLKGTEIWPDREKWKDSILFFETSEEEVNPSFFEFWLRNYASQGILQNCKGILFGKPHNHKYYKGYKEAVRKVVDGELGLHELPVLYNMSFGHTAPVFTLPYGAIAEIDCDRTEFSILESGVL